MPELCREVVSGVKGEVNIIIIYIYNGSFCDTAILEKDSNWLNLMSPVVIHY